MHVWWCTDSHISYSPTLFHAAGRVLGPIDIAAIPIGAYEPKWHLHLQHTDPEGAVRMAMQMGVKKSIGVHWGTWLMSDEACKWILACIQAPSPRVVCALSQCARGRMSLSGLSSSLLNICILADNAPPMDLAIARKKLEVDEEAFCVLPAGKTIVVE